MLPYFTLSEISSGAITIQVWGLCVALGIGTALSASVKAARRKKLDEEIVWSVMILSLLGMIIGSRIFYMVSNPLASPSLWLDLRSGFSFLGGAVLAGIAVLSYLRFKRQDCPKVFDLLTPGFIVALIWTRIGCFLVGDHVGKVTTLPWGMWFPDGTVRHPVTLYEIIFLLAALLVLRAVGTANRPSGFVFLSFGLAYAAFRFAFDFLRCADLSFCDPRFGGLTATQWLLPLLVFVLLISGRGKKAWPL